jgi:glycosyltransferase involved in cell wall biosynthesis
MKIAVVTCYRQNDYVRARSLRTTVAACRGVDAIVVRNRHKGFLRYPEIALRLCWLRLVRRPDAYVLTFRGYETLLLMRLSLVRKPIIFDELVNFTEWMEEHGRLKPDSLTYRCFRGWNRWLVKCCRLIVADTDAHAEYSSILNKLSIKKYRVLAVSADETVFHPTPASDRSSASPFVVLYYGSMLALHGVDYVLEAARQLKDEPNISFRFIGGKDKIAKACAAAAADGAHVTYEKWVPFETLASEIQAAGLTLGGPFGGTLQSQFVVTGKTYQVLASGSPVLIGENKVHEGFIDKKNCLIVPQAKAAAITEAVRWAYEHPKELKAVGQQGRQLYERRFSQAAANKLVAEMVAELRDGAG